VIQVVWCVDLLFSSTQLVGCLLDVEDGPQFLLLHTLVPDHSGMCELVIMSLNMRAYLESMRTSSPSTSMWGFGTLASSTKWLSQCGQYSSLPLIQQVYHHVSCWCTYASSNSRASFLNAFLHFLQMKTMSKVCVSGWSACSAWHSAQSNHFLPGHDEPLFYYTHFGGPTAQRADGDLGVENVFAVPVSAAEVTAGFYGGARAYHMAAARVSVLGAMAGRR
jgi:hypothetical protein